VSPRVKDTASANGRALRREACRDSRWVDFKIVP